MNSKKKKIKEAQDILNSFGLPAAQQNQTAALTLLALCDIKVDDTWEKASNKSKTVSNDIMSFAKEIYKKAYKPNSRETFRRQVLHQFVEAGLVVYNRDKPDLPVNSPNAHYALSNEALQIIRQFKTDKFDELSSEFSKNTNILSKEISKERASKHIPVTFGDQTFILTPGKHNELEVEIIQNFAPRFAQNCVVLYLGDTGNKSLYFDEAILKLLKIPFDKHSKLPDVVLFIKDKNWLYLIESVTSHGPITPKRILELERLLKKCKAGKIYVSAFPDFQEFKRHAPKIAWETEVWISETPSHLIHFNGDKFIGPRT